MYFCILYKSHLIVFIIQLTSIQIDIKSFYLLQVFFDDLTESLNLYMCCSQLLYKICNRKISSEYFHIYQAIEILIAFLLTILWFKKNFFFFRLILFLVSKDCFFFLGNWNWWICTKTDRRKSLQWWNPLGSWIFTTK